MTLLCTHSLHISIGPWLCVESAISSNGWAVHCRLAATIELCHVLHSTAPTVTQRCGFARLALSVRMLILTSHQYLSRVFASTSASPKKKKGGEPECTLQTARTLQPGQNIAKVGKQGDKKAKLIIVIEVCKSVASVSKKKPEVCIITMGLCQNDQYSITLSVIPKICV